jgi:hypothetical protein
MKYICLGCYEPAKLVAMTEDERRQNTAHASRETNVYMRTP